ncbi:syntaxin-7 [Podarcis lilfordi]|uniref:Syntaxin-7 n=1 Tax=Podarcis lilfordi TaxID=74358 RepID=A0AA35K3A0_9SAUR|nr:syntaxin-7 [Podarcis lilfordi]
MCLNLWPVAEVSEAVGIRQESLAMLDIAPENHKQRKGGGAWRPRPAPSREPLRLLQQRGGAPGAGPPPAGQLSGQGDQVRERGKAGCPLRPAGTRRQATQEAGGIIGESFVYDLVCIVPIGHAQRITSNIQKITQCTAEIQRVLNQLGTPQDTHELRQQLQQKQQYTNQLAKETDKYIKEFGSLPSISEQRQRKIQKDRLVNEFTTALTNFQRVQRQAAEKEREFVARVRASSRVSGGAPEESYKEGTLVSWDSQPQTQILEEEITEDDLRLIEERESAIRQLEADILDINEIFKDLGMMIHEQGDVIDSIEANVETAEVHVQQANQQLSRAADYQRKSRKKLCILILVLVAGATILGLIIWGATKS